MNEAMGDGRWEPRSGAKYAPAAYRLSPIA